MRVPAVYLKMMDKNTAKYGWQFQQRYVSTVTDTIK